MSDHDPKSKRGGDAGGFAFILLYILALSVFFAPIIAKLLVGHD